MNRFLVLSFFIMVNSICLAQSTPKYIVLPLNEVQSSGLIAAIEYHKKNHSFKIYRLVAMEDDDDIIVLFYTSPPKPIQKEIRGGGEEMVKVIYSKKHMKVVKSKLMYDR